MGDSDGDSDRRLGWETRMGDSDGRLGWVARRGGGRRAEGRSERQGPTRMKRVRVLMRLIRVTIRLIRVSHPSLSSESHLCRKEGPGPLRHVDEERNLRQPRALSLSLSLSQIGRAHV